ncbi:endonuclease/exonuclease/phosphatase family protein [Salinispira pacifica]|uniref:Endonuclease/exonuclease/phosphatase family protein n=2 Tax=Salinispira pacifica TaxID=1307761 RepID=V5WNI7_9SPIO|nr:endonuclease/exonuclease/phosphatase family protein [Salinispira pacifica]
MYDRVEEAPRRITGLSDLLQSAERDLWFLQEVVSILPDDFIAPVNRIFNMLKNMDEYGLISADSYSRTGNINPILYSKARFSPVRSGTYWFSHNAFVPDSRSWGNTRPRQMTWAVLYDRAADSCISVVNLHLDHASAESRKPSVEMMFQVIHQERLNAHPIIIAGDFNSISPSKTGRLLLEQFHEAEYPGGSFRRLPMSIDHIFYRSLEELDCRAESVTISDHKMVTARFTYPVDTIITE